MPETVPNLTENHLAATAPRPFGFGGRTRHHVVFVAATLSAVGVDIGSKVWASTALPGDPIVIGPIVLRLVHNRGMAFGAGSYLPAWTLIALTAAISVGIAIVGWRGRLDPPAGAGLMLGGAVANVGDRLTEGSVVDFIDIGDWPVFNLADVLLLAGVGIVLLARRHPNPTSQGTGEIG